MRKHFFKCVFVFGAFIISHVLFAQGKDIPNGYYDDAAGLSGYPLKTALYNIIKGHTVRTYSQLWTDFQTTDNDGVFENDNTVLDIYSENPTGSDPYNFIWFTDQDTGSGSHEGDAYNREHSFPKSWFAQGTPMYTDLFHLYPADRIVNTRRSNHPYGEVENPTWTSENGSKLGPCSYPGYTGTVFEPVDAFKGDLARTYFYMATRYENVVSSWPGSDMLDGSSDQVFADWALNMLLEWNQNDPVSQKEILRNEAVYSIQHNRNPFIDHPEYVAKIWSGNASTNFNNVLTQPAEPTNADAVTVSVQITDDDGIRTVTLNWGTVSGNLDNSIAMHNTTGDTYQTTTQIPAQSNGTVVYYNISVTDDLDVMANSSEYSYNIGNIPEVLVLLDEDFETTQDHVALDLNGWLNYNELGDVLWEGRTFSSNLYAHMSSYTSQQENVVWLVTPQIDLDNTNQETFSFDVNVGYWTHVGLQVLLSQNFNGTDVIAATWQDITHYFNIPTEPTNAYGTLSNAGSMSLHDVSGKIYIAFKYSGNDTGETGETTTYQIDNVHVEGMESLDDTTAPVLAFSPADGAENVAVTSQIEITASEKLLNADGNTITNTYLSDVIILKKDNSNGPNISFSASIDATQKIITLIPDIHLSYETVYYLGILADAFEDTAQNATLPYELTFTTESTPDVEAPVFAFSPADGAENVAVTSQIEITASEKLLNADGNTITNTYLSDVIILKKDNSNGPNISFSASIDATQKIITLIPDIHLSYETVYYLGILADAFEDTAQNGTLPYELTFTTESTPDVEAPVFAFSPADGAENVAVDAMVVIAANEPLYTNQGETLTVNYIKTVIDFTDENAQSIAYTPAIGTENKSITLIPDAELKYGMIYSVSISNQAFEDSSGNKTAAANLVFSTQPLVDEDAPQFTFEPTHGQTNVEPDVHINIMVNEPIYTSAGSIITPVYLQAIASINALELNGDVGVAVDFSATFSSEENKIQLIPDAPLDYEKTFQVSIIDNAFEDTAGNESDPQLFTFTTRPLVDITPPILTCNLSNDSVGVAINAEVIILSDDILFETGGDNPSNSYVQQVVHFYKDSLTGDVVNYTASIAADNRSLTLTPDNLLNYQTTYMVRVDSAAFQDAAGNGTATLVNTFTTAADPDVDAPVFLGGTPLVDTITPTMVKIVVQLDEPGRVYYKIQHANMTDPDFSEVIDASSMFVNVAQQNFTLIVSGLNALSDYKVFMLAQDNSASQNMNDNFTILSFTTTGYAPQIITQPASQEICELAPFYLFVEASGSDTLTYTWYSNNQAIPDTDNDTLFFNTAQVTDAANYYCKVKNNWGQAISQPGTVSIQELLFAGDDYSILLPDTLSAVNLFDSLPGNPDDGGYFTDDSNSGALSNGIFNPKIAGAGTYRFTYTINGSCNTDNSVLIVTVESANGIISKTNAHFVLYPNPTSGNVYISQNSMEPAYYFIHNAHGVVVKSGRLRENSISLGNLNPGIYWIRIVSGSVTVSHKVQKY